MSAVTLRLVERVGLPPEAREEMMLETVQVWRAAGLDVTWAKFPVAGTQVSAPVPSRPAITVVVTPDTPEALRSSSMRAPVLASILFVDRRPTTLIAAYPGEVQRLLETVRLDARAVGERPASMRHRLMGRVLGRAIAHELGHFMFGSSMHTPDGLMRAKHRLDDLTSPYTQAFRVIPALDSCSW